MQATTVVAIGAGPAGLAMSRCLRDESIDHVLLERAEVAHSWRQERWDSLRTLTDFVIGHEVDGMTILGVLGEGAKLSDAERSAVIATTLGSLSPSFSA